MAPRSKARKGKISTPSRPYWSGTIRMSLVSLPVNIFTATDRTAELHFHQLHKQTGKRVRYQKTVPGVGPVEMDDIVKGYEIEKGKYIVVEPEELKALKLESSNTFDITRLVDHSEIDAIYFDAPYYVAPSEEGAVDAFVVIRDALRSSNKIGLGQIVIGGRERIASIQACGKGMLLETLRYADDIKEAEKFFEPIDGQKADKEQLELARQLIEQKAGPFEPSEFKDHYEDAVRDLLEKKRKGQKIVTDEDEPEAKGAEVIDLMEALKRSVVRKESARPAARKHPPRKKAAGGRR